MAPTTSGPVGVPVASLNVKTPDQQSLHGTYVTLERLSTAHVTDLYTSLCGPDTDVLWTYLDSGPFGDDATAFTDYVERNATLTTVASYAVIPLGCPPASTGAAAPSDGPIAGEAAGIVSLMNTNPAHGVMEVGSIASSARLQRTRASTEALYLISRYAFEELGCRRLEWKCDDLNAPSRRAGERLGFVYEGTFRQHMVVKGRNRDTAWYSIVDSEWRDLCAPALQAWLAERNFDENGMQREGLRDIRARLASA